ncbi:MAG: TetR/AcrR family transcriptional regulator [Campylobacteraceae bacterium]|nr:TetR/AcrR family transcriptional regulator [Campylobacteraceae bacterium]
MARIIDKEEKKCSIAKASIDLFCEKGIQQTSIEEIAKSAGVAKGTVYLYFKNKEEIVFAIWDMIVERHIKAFESSITPSMSAKEKIIQFYKFSEFDNKDESEKILHLYQHFLSSMLVDNSGLFTAYFESFFKVDYDFISNCLEEGKRLGEFEIDDIHNLANTIVLVLKGAAVKAKASNLHFNEAQAFITEQISFLLENFTRNER